MYTNILVPVDGSDTSMCGLKEALDMADICPGCKIRLLHVVNEYIFQNAFDCGVYSDELIDSLRMSGSQVLDSAEALVRRRGRVPERVMLETIGGAAADAIIQQAREWPADLIVMGTHGRRGLARVAMGSDAEAVVRSAGIPVLMVRGTAPRDAGAAATTQRRTA